MKTQKENQENDVYFLGSGETLPKDKKTKKTAIITAICIIATLLVILCLFLLNRNKTPDYYFEPETSHQADLEKNAPEMTAQYDSTDNLQKGYIEVLEETVNDVPLFVYVPHNAEMSLKVGMPDKYNTGIIFTAQAADIRADNKKIVGDFVLSGEQISKGIAKTGFCAVIDGQITIGVSENTPLLQKAIESGGYFFRQYPLVYNGELIENNPKNKSIRRALAVRGNKIIMVESRSTESFHDFAQALIDIGVSNAIYLVGSIAHGWYYDKNYLRHEFGIEQDSLPESTTYIIWQSI